MNEKTYISVDDIDTSKDKKGIYYRDEIYYRNSFESGVCSALHYLAKQPAAEVVSLEDYNALKAENEALKEQIAELTVEDKMSALQKQFEKEYSSLYDGTNEKKAQYSEYVDKGDNLLNEKSEIVSEFAKQRGDCLSSDREVAAFAIAYEKIYESEKEQTKPKKAKNNIERD